MRWRLIFLVLLLSPRAWGQAPSPLKAIPPGEDVIVPLRQGEPAPFSGQLFDAKTSLRWGNYLEQALARLQLDRELEKKLGQAEADFWKAKLDLERSTWTAAWNEEQKRRAVVEAQLRDRPFYTSVWFGAAVATVITSATVVAITQR